MMGLANSMAVSSLRQNPPTCCELALIFSRGPLRAELWSQVLHHPVTPMRWSPPLHPTFQLGTGASLTENTRCDRVLKDQIFSLKYE